MGSTCSERTWEAGTLSGWQLLCAGNVMEAGLDKTRLGRRAGGRMRAEKLEQRNDGVFGENMLQKQGDVVQEE